MGICGKFSFEDEVTTIYEPEEFIKTYNVYVGKNDIVPLNIREPKDLVPYYPYMIGLQAHDADGGICCLREESYIDTNEREHFEWRLHSLQRYWRKCKRNKTTFDKNEALKLIVWPTDDKPEECDIELVNRVAEQGDNATVDDLHDSLHDSMRDEWYQMMIDAGWNESKAYRWVYGWKRWANKFMVDKYGDHAVQQTIEGYLDDSNSQG